MDDLSTNEQIEMIKALVDNELDRMACSLLRLTPEEQEGALTEFTTIIGEYVHDGAKIDMIVDQHAKVLPNGVIIVEARGSYK